MSSLLARQVTEFVVQRMKNLLIVAGYMMSYLVLELAGLTDVVVAAAAELVSQFLYLADQYEPVDLFGRRIDIDVVFVVGLG